MKNALEDEDYAARYPDEQMNDQEGGHASANKSTSFHRVDIPTNTNQLLEMYKAVQEYNLSYNYQKYSNA